MRRSPVDVTVRPLHNSDIRVSRRRFDAAIVESFIDCCAVLCWSGLLTPAFSQDVRGAGSTFVYPVLSKWMEAYKAETGVRIGYQAVGSGTGIWQIKSRTVDFGASDAPLRPDELNAAGLVQFPIVVGGVVPVVNLEGIRPGQL